MIADNLCMVLPCLRKIIPSLLLLLLATTSAFGETLRERHNRVRSAIQAGNVQQAITELESIRGSNKELFALNNYDYLLARLHEKNGNKASSTASYLSVAERNSLLSGYAFWHLAQIARSTGDLVQEREHLRRLILISHPILVRDAAIFRLGESFLESGDYSSAISALQPLTISNSRSVARSAQALTAEALLKAEKQQEARQLFARIVMQMPDASRPDDFALAGVRALDELDSSAGTQLTEAEHLLRASVYQFNRDFEGARWHYAAVVESYPQSGTVANALYQIGRGFYLLQNYDEALNYFQSVLTEFPESTSARDALTFMAGAYNRLEKTDDAIAAYRRLIERYPDGANPDRPYLNIIDALHEAGRHKEALYWAQQTRSRFKGQLGAAIALFAQTRIHLAQGAWSAVVVDTDELLKLRDLGGTQVPGGATKSEVAFLRAYSLEQLGRTDAAIHAYLSVPDGRNEYYGGLSTRRLRTLATDPKWSSTIQQRAKTLHSESEKALASGQADSARRLAHDALRLSTEQAIKNRLVEILKQTYRSLPAYQFPSFTLVSVGRQQVAENATQAGRSSIADELLFLGLYDQGVPEFALTRSSGAGIQSVPARTPSGLTDVDYTLAVYSLRGELANRAVRFGEQVWRSIPADYVIELAPPEMVELLYPLPYRESLLKHATSRGVDPRLVISIARQESRFQADAKSVAAARGLMQFIPSTADEVAAELGLNPFRQDKLYLPDTAILFGSQYLANLFAQFPGQTEAVAASYNGGPDNMARWLARSRATDPSRYVSEIGFTQTKDYVFKIMTNLWIYQRLYDEQLQRQT